MTDSAPHLSPYGLGWARRLAEMSAPPDATLRERFDRQLLVGMVAVSASMFGFGSVLALPFAPLDESLVGFLPALANLAVLVVLLARGGRVTTYAHLFLATGFPLPVFGAIYYGGGTAGWVQITWTLAYPIVAALLTGARGGIAWTALTAVALGALAMVERSGAMPEYTGTEFLADPLMNAFGLISVALFQMLAVTWFIQQRGIVEGLLADERAAAEALLRNVLPASVADRLRKGEVVADHVDEVTVVFADLVGFTPLAASLPARRVVELLAELFGAIDQIAEQEGVEKVKTIGDCYMAVAGAPIPCDDHADRALRFACRVRDLLHGWTRYGATLDVRVGVHSGPAMAGVLGQKRLLYDLWGDTVNVASRLESSSVPGQVQASAATLKLAADRWHIEDRGEVALKGRAAMRTAFVHSPDAPAPPARAATEDAEVH